MTVTWLIGVGVAWLAATPSTPAPSQTPTALPPPPMGVTCAKKSVTRGFVPPEGFEQWCERRKSGAYVRHGPYRAWHASGQPFIEAEYCSGKRCGRYAEWYPNGRPKSLGEFDTTGRYQGHWTFWSDSGEAIEQDFSQGQLIASNSIPATEEATPVDGGTPVAEPVSPDAGVEEHLAAADAGGPGVGGSAPVQQTETVMPGPAVLATQRVKVATTAVICPSGAIPGGQPFPQGLVQWCQKQDRYGRWVRHGILREWYPNGMKRSESDYAHGRTTGWVTRWYPNGQKAEETHYRYGVPDGRSTRWSEQGLLLGEVVYRFGEPVGETREPDPIYPTQPF